MVKTSPSRVGFVKSSGVPSTLTTRPVGMRASSTSVLHIARQEKTITQTCGSLARQFYPVINNGVVVAQVEVGVVGHVQHCRLGRHRSYPEHFRKRMCSTCSYWLQIQGCLSKSVRNRDENVPRETLVSIRRYQAESESLTVLCFPLCAVRILSLSLIPEGERSCVFIQPPLPQALVPASEVSVTKIWTLKLFFLD